MKILFGGKRINGYTYSFIMVRNGQRIEKKEWDTLFPSQAELFQALRELKAAVA